MLYNGVFGCHGNTCYVIFIGAIFYMLHSIGPISVCTDFEINRYKIDEVRKYANIAFYLIYLTSRDAKTLRHASWGLDTSDTYFNKEHFETNQKSLRLYNGVFGCRFNWCGSKVIAQIVVFVFSVTLTLTFDLCSFFLSHALRMMYWNIHAKFH